MEVAHRWIHSSICFYCRLFLWLRSIYSDQSSKEGYLKLYLLFSKPRPLKSALDWTPMQLLSLSMCKVSVSPTWHMILWKPARLWSSRRLESTNLGRSLAPRDSIVPSRRRNKINSWLFIMQLNKRPYCSLKLCKMHSKNGWNLKIRAIIKRVIISLTMKKEKVTPVTLTRCRLDNATCP